MKFVIPFLLFLAIVSTSSAQNQAQSSAPLELFAVAIMFGMNDDGRGYYVKDAA